MKEQEKYEAMWKNPNYREVAPGEYSVQLFLEQANPREGSTVIDFGTGTGRGALMLAIMGMKVRMVDFAENCLDEDVRAALTTQAHMLSFVKHDLTQKIPFAEAYGYCTDVMEHIPTEDVPLVMKNILQAAQHVFFQISCVDDTMGASIGETLHMTVKPYKWWLDLFKQFDCVIHWSQDVGGQYALFYVTAWQDGQALTDAGILNVGEEKAKENVKHNIVQGYAQVEPYQVSPVEVVLLGGGPSLLDNLATIKQLKAEGCKIVTLNGAYKWALDNDLGPVTEIIVDARPFNARFVEPVREDCMYLIASQCDPSVFAKLPKPRVFIWHSCSELFKDILNAQYPVWYGVPGGTTVMLRALPLLRMLGFKRFHMFGFDSCLQTRYALKNKDTGKWCEGTFDGKKEILDYNTREMAETMAPGLADYGEPNVEIVEMYGHHAYQQPENDVDMVMPVNVGGRIFPCHAWMASQASEFIKLIAVFGNEIELEVYGDGLLRHILQHGADLADEATLTTEE